MDPEIIQVFLEEYHDMVKILDSELTKYPSAKISVFDIFRVFHTLKGNSSTLGFLRLSSLCSEYCDYFRPKQKENSISEIEYTALSKCLETLQLFSKRIQKGKKGRSIKTSSIKSLLIKK
jgi:two-component system chemotaxis sensor kinase CheA